MQKELSNDQRARLEQIARDEFTMKRGEISQEKQNVLTAWKKAEIKRMEATPLFKKYVKLDSELEKASVAINKQGFSINNISGGGLEAVINGTAYDCYTQSSRANEHPKYGAMEKASRTDANGFTRSLNEVLAVIWSMEKPFKECMALIASSIKKIK